MSGETGTIWLPDQNLEFADLIAEVLAAFVLATEDICLAVRIRDGQRLFEAITELTAARSRAITLVEPGPAEDLG
jgi:hypothetical protein